MKLFEKKTILFFNGLNFKIIRERVNRLSKVAEGNSSVLFSGSTHN